jgi:hypothetical protein
VAHEDPGILKKQKREIFEKERKKKKEGRNSDLRYFPHSLMPAKGLDKLQTVER